MLEIGQKRFGISNGEIIEYEIIGWWGPSFVKDPRIVEYKRSNSSFTHRADEDILELQTFANKVNAINCAITQREKYIMEEKKKLKQLKELLEENK